MKKWIFLPLCSCIFMTACSKDEGRTVNNEIDTEGRIAFDLSVTNRAGNGVGSRARDLYSQEALQDITRVNVYAFQKSGENYLFYRTFPVDNWDSALDTTIYLVPENNMLPAGEYSFIALGQEAADQYTLTSLEAGVTDLTGVTASVAAPGNVQELFSGTQTASIASRGGRVKIELTRKVSGVLGYFKNVPAEINGDTVRFLRLTISDANKSVSLADGTGNTPAGEPYNVIDIALTGQAIASGVYTGNDLSAAGIQKVANSQLAGKFVIPIANITMTLGLYDENGAALKTWNIVSASGTTFSLTPNNFFSLGRKVFAGNTDGVAPGDPADPNQEDNAIDLLTDQEIFVTISADWGAIDQLTLQ